MTVRTGSASPVRLPLCWQTKVQLSDDERAVMEVLASRGAVEGTEKVARAAFPEEPHNRSERLMRASRVLVALRDRKFVDWSLSEGGLVVWQLVADGERSESSPEP
ncbi:hypothetical protein D7S55_17215 [Ralstonia pickettii]|nr:hypothetical protein [Ralstonia pickettii]MBA9851959.1 hypothetical protein [Ralstonia pickettii]MBA9919684.1 hypothetical protein [Ralstonia pickettii]MBA9958912.1 hypothetical protein [Ralstonia pickettii]MBA9965101.1 hypothetical protein [Ralstonia pickettii]